MKSRKDLQQHVNERTAKTESLLNNMLPLGETNGGLPLGAFRALLMGAIRLISTWGAES